MAEISVVITIYNAENIISELVRRLRQSLSLLTEDYELIFIEDRSRDQSWKLLKQFALADKRIKLARMARNFGQHSANSAGLHFANGHYVVMMDGDLQDEPEVIPQLYNQIRSSGTEIIYVKRMNRKDSWVHRTGSRLFYRIFSGMSGIETDSRIGTFRIMTRLVCDSFCKFREVNKYISGVFYWMGFEHGFLEAEQTEQKNVRSNYNLAGRLRLAANGIFSFSNKPLNIATYIGLASTVGAIIAGVYLLGRKVFCNADFSNAAAIIVSLYFLAGLILFVLGIIGQYIGRIYEQAKARPEFLLQEKINL